MKRDLSLILDILRFVEEHRRPEGNQLRAPEMDCHEPEYVREHVRLCEEAGLLNSARDKANNKHGAIERLTWSGHEYLDANRNK